MHDYSCSEVDLVINDNIFNSKSSTHLLCEKSFQLPQEQSLQHKRKIKLPKRYTSAQSDCITTVKNLQASKQEPMLAQQNN